MENGKWKMENGWKRKSPARSRGALLIVRWWGEVIGLVERLGPARTFARGVQNFPALANDFALVLPIAALDSPQFLPFSEDNMNSPKEPAKNAHSNEQSPNERRDGPMADEGATLDASPSSLGEQTEAAQHRRVGPYRLTRKLGQGGMGHVWLAEQTAPLRRQVALKLIKAGLFDDALLERFQGERQSLALMNHPAIAKVFDAGATPEGQPYFAMEYVEGLPITDYVTRSD
jgi:hypothetical protein